MFWRSEGEGDLLPNVRATIQAFATALEGLDHASHHLTEMYHYLKSIYSLGSNIAMFFLPREQEHSPRFMAKVLMRHGNPLCLNFFY